MFHAGAENEDPIRYLLIQSIDSISPDEQSAAVLYLTLLPVTTKMLPITNLRVG